MVQVLPFTGYLYNQDKTGPADGVTAPPYDVISPELQKELYEQNPHNIVRLILGEEFADDSEGNNRYSRAAETFQQWIEQEILTQDDQPAFYVYSQDYSFEGKAVCRTGFFARVKTEDFEAGNICPHEFTLAKAKKDRSLLLKACRANFSPIFGLYSDPQGEIDAELEKIKQETPFAEIEKDGVSHKVWRFLDTTIQARITESFQDKKIFIADGHHRYETALGYHKENAQEVPDSAHVMMFLTNLDAQSLAIYPIHRLIKCPDAFDEQTLLSKIGQYFDLHAMPGTTDPETIKETLEKNGTGQIVFCVYLGSGNCHLMTLKDTKPILGFLGPDEPVELQVLDVAQLHTLVIKSILNIDSKVKENQQYISYKVNVAEAMKRVDTAEFDLAFFMNPTRIDQVRQLAENGIRLPQKATFFYPELLSGLVINKFQS